MHTNTTAARRGSSLGLIMHVHMLIGSQTGRGVREPLPGPDHARAHAPAGPHAGSPTLAHQLWLTGDRVREPLPGRGGGAQLQDRGLHVRCRAFVFPGAHARHGNVQRVRHCSTTRQHHTPARTCPAHKEGAASACAPVCVRLTRTLRCAAHAFNAPPQGLSNARGESSNPLKQVLDAVGEEVACKQYDRVRAGRPCARKSNGSNTGTLQGLRAGRGGGACGAKKGRPAGRGGGYQEQLAAARTHTRVRMPQCASQAATHAHPHTPIFPTSHPKTHARAHSGSCTPRRAPSRAWLGVPRTSTTSRSRAGRRRWRSSCCLRRSWRRCSRCDLASQIK